MAYDTQLADRVRAYLVQIPNLKVEEKEMFGGLAFLVNGKMCVNVSRQNLMCRFDPAFSQKLAGRKGFQSMIMRGTQYKGYGYVDPTGLKNKKDLEYWINLCLDFNSRARSSKK